MHQIYKILHCFQIDLTIRIMILKFKLIFFRDLVIFIRIINNNLNKFKNKKKACNKLINLISK